MESARLEPVPSAFELAHLGLRVVVAGRQGDVGECLDLLGCKLDSLGRDVLLESADAAGGVAASSAAGTRYPNRDSAPADGVQEWLPLW
jgi:hypothetical protein